MLKEKSAHDNRQLFVDDGFFCLLRELSDRGISFDGKRYKSGNDSGKTELFIHPNGQTIESDLQDNLRRYKSELIHWYENHSAPGSTSVLSLIDEMTILHPQKTALSFYGGTHSYQTLQDSSTRYALALQQQGVSLGMRVGVCLSRTPELIICMLAILKLGAVLVPLSSSNPTERLRTFCEQGRLSYILCNDECEPITNGVAAKILPLRMILSIDTTCLPVEERVIYSALPAYMMFTSGSSGKPKGVVVSHQALALNLSAIDEHVGINETSAVLAHSDIAFDISLLELLGPLIVGGTVVLVGDEDCKKPHKLCAEINSGICNVVQATPSLWQLLLMEGFSFNKDFTLISGGEALKKELAKALLKAHGPFWNLYGPTEATIWVSAQWVDEESTRNVELTLPIGLPIGRNRLHLVRTLIKNGEEAEPVTEELNMDTKAELWISGPSLASGYFDNLGLNRKSFVFENELAGSATRTDLGQLMSERYYRTGDVVSKGLDGNFVFHSRMDNQVKLHGYRIELEEIEQALSQHPSVQHAVVSLHNSVELNEGGSDTLAAYVVFISGSHNKTRNKLNEFLARRLPEYMLPSRYLVLDAIPLTSNNKLDYAALREMNEDISGIRVAHDGKESSVLERVHSMVCQLTGRKEAGLYESFFDLGGSSMLAATLLMKINNTFSIELALHSVLDRPPTIMSLTHLVNNKLSKI